MNVPFKPNLWGKVNPLLLSRLFDKAAQPGSFIVIETGWGFRLRETKTTYGTLRVLQTKGVEQSLLEVVK
jgi:hypothetical protein